MEVSNEMMIFLYSQQCNYSKLIKQRLQRGRDLNISIICVDHPVIKKKIVESKHVKVTKVPCFILVSDQGDVTVYENNIESIMRELVSSSQEMHPQESVAPPSFPVSYKDTIRESHTLLFDGDTENQKTTPLDNIHPTTITPVDNSKPTQKSAKELAKEMQKEREDMFSNLKNNRK